MIINSEPESRSLSAPCVVYPLGWHILAWKVGAKMSSFFCASFRSRSAMYSSYCKSFGWNSIAHRWRAHSWQAALKMQNKHDRGGRFFVHWYSMTVVEECWKNDHRWFRLRNFSVPEYFPEIIERQPFNRNFKIQLWPHFNPQYHGLVPANWTAVSDRKVVKRTSTITSRRMLRCVKMTLCVSLCVCVCVFLFELS